MIKKHFLKDKHGLAWVWATTVITICFLPLVYWACRVMISFLLGFALFGIAIWALVNAKAESSRVKVVMEAYE